MTRQPDAAAQGRPVGDWAPESLEPIRSLHVLASNRYGGLESVVLSLTQGLLRAGHDCHVVAIVDGELDPHPFQIALQEAGVPVSALRVAGRAYLRERRELTGLCDSIRPQLLHSHGYRADVQTIAVGLRIGLPVVSTVHGFTGGDWKMALYERLQERSLRRAAAVAAVSRPIRDRLVRRGVDPDRIRWIANAWEENRDLATRGEARAALGIERDARVVGWVGRLSWEKGPDVLLEAVPMIAQADVQVCFVGDGPEQDRLVSRANELGISSRVRFAGAMPEAARLFPAFDAFCLSSRTEGTPIALLEAMNAGVPIVATRVGGVPDVVSDREARLFSSEDPAKLARALEAALADDPVSSERVKCARRRLGAEFALGPWLQRYERLYSDVLRAATDRRAAH